MRQRLILIMLIPSTLFFTECKRCRDGEKKENVDIPIDQKNAIFRFSEGTRWVFKSNGGEMDTVYLGPLLYYYDNGNCQDSKCCTKLYVQIIKQRFTTVSDLDGLDKIDYHYDNGSHWLRGKLGGTFEFSTYQSFNKNYKSILTVNGTTLNDVEYQVYPGVNLGDAGIDAAYWSLSKGLIRYDYQKADGSFIIYERQDL